MANSVLSFAFLPIFLSFVFFGNTTTAHFFPPPPMQVFILAGQSNMAGRGGAAGRIWDEYVPKECAADPMIHRLNADLTWEIAYEPIHRDIDNKNPYVICGVGPSMSFANMIKDSIGGAHIGFVPCAIGNTKIIQWSRGSVIYEDMVKRASVAAASGEIKTFLWYQGEGDTNDIDDVNNYEHRMISLIQNVRDDLNMPWLPIIQLNGFIIGGTCVWTGNQTFLDAIRAIQKGIKVSNVICVDELGLPLNGDNVHLTTASQVKLGRMLGDAYIYNFNTVKI